MKLLPFLALSASIFAMACQQPAEEKDSVRAPADPKQVEWEALPEGKSYLFAGRDSSGTPVYTPVQIRDTFAIVEGDIIVASGAKALEDLKAELVDPRDPAAKPAPLAKASGFVRNTTYTGQVNAWPNGAIPYIIHGGLSKTLIEKAVYEFNTTSSGVSYVPWSDKFTNCVLFIGIAGNASYSAVGMTNPNSCQTIQVGTSGATIPVLLHEMAHAAGMYHEQQRPDRDGYITITTSGPDGDNWAIRTTSKLNDGTMVGAYDLKSIMHYTTGTTNWPNPDGTFFKVTMAAKNGTSLSGTSFTVDDKNSLWGIQANAYPFMVRGFKAGMTNKMSKLYTTYANVAKRWIILYDPATGWATVHAVNPDNNIGAPQQSINIGAGFNTINPYTANSSARPHMLFYGSGNGRVKGYRIDPNTGFLGVLAMDTYWNAGWTTMEAYESEGKSFWFMQNGVNFNVNIWAVTDAGGLGAFTYHDIWTNWVYAKPFYLERSPITYTTYMVMRASNGLTRIRSMPNTGSIGPTVGPDVTLSTYPAVGLWQSGTKAYLALSGGNALFIHDIDERGFNPTRGTPIYRAVNMGGAIKRIDASVDLYNVNAGGAQVGIHWTEMRHALTYEWTTNKDVIFFALGAPFR